MRTNATLNNFYLAFLILELVVVAYDGLFNDSTSGQWVRVVVVAVSVLGFYGWSRGLRPSWKWVWRFAFVLVCGWFFLYLPLEVYRERETLKRTIDEFGLAVITPAYMLFYLVHIPLFVALYSAAFRGAPNGTSPQAAQS